MGDMADDTLDRLANEDEAQMRVLGHSNVFQFRKSKPTHCAHCRSELVKRDGKYGPFLCCPQWPACKGTRYGLAAVEQNELSSDDQWLMDIGEHDDSHSSR